MNRVKRPVVYALWAAIIAGAIGALWYFVRPAPIKIETATVARRRIETTVESEAKTRIHDRYVVSATVPGRLLRLRVEEGDRVSAGERIASIDPLPLDASVASALEKLRELDAQISGVETLRPKEETLAQAQSRVRQSLASASSAHERAHAAQIALEQANRDAERQAQLERQGYASHLSREQAESAQRLRARERDIARTDAAAAEAQVAMDRAAVQELQKKVRDPDYLRTVYGAQANAIRAQLRTLEDERSRTNVTAPVGGEVLRVLQKSESYVSSGTPILEIGNRKTLEIIADVLSQDVVHVHPGDRVEVVSGAGGAHVRGTVRRIEPSGFTKISALGIEEQRVNVLIDVRNPPPSLGDGYRLDVRIVTSAADALSVPVPALFRCDSDWCAYVVRDKRVHRVVVRTGRFGSEDAEVIGGLAQGEVVVLRPPESITDNARVR